MHTNNKEVCTSQVNQFETRIVLGIGLMQRIVDIRIEDSGFVQELMLVRNFTVCINPALSKRAYIEGVE